jgi:hypothetical protein
MKVGTLTFQEAVDKMYIASSIMADQLGEFVSFTQIDDLIQIYPQSGSDDKYEFLKSQNETVEVHSTLSSKSSFQYMRMYTEDGDEMDFVLFEPSPIITLDSLLHPVN